MSLCQNCGACCSVWPVFFYNLKGLSEDIVEKTPEFPIMRMKHDETMRCCCLSGEIGKKVSCNIYEERPTPCIQFEEGSERCLEARKKFNLES